MVTFYYLSQRFKSQEDLRDQLVFSDRYEITYELGKTNWFVASGVTDVFLVQVYTRED